MEWGKALEAGRDIAGDCVCSRWLFTMNYETAEQIIQRMAEIYEAYRISPYNEDMTFDEWLTGFTGHDDLIDLFIAADDLMNEA
jgi:hypothetical protein